MTVRIPENIPPHLHKLAERLDIQIKSLESRGTLQAVFDKDEQRELQILGYEDYLAYLKRTRQELGQPDGLSEE